MTAAGAQVERREAGPAGAAAGGEAVRVAAALQEKPRETRVRAAHVQRAARRRSPACCAAACRSPGKSTPHFIYMHPQKTGGSSVECALQEAAGKGLVDLLGHAPAAVYDACAARCKAAGVQARRLLTVREPFDYWASIYKYAWTWCACLSRPRPPHPDHTHP